MARNTWYPYRDPEDPFFDPAFGGGGGGGQPEDSDLTAIAALTTTTFGRSLLALADQAALLSAAGAAASGHSHSAPAFVGWRLTKSGNQSVGDNNAPNLTFDVEEFDSDGFHTGSAEAVVIPTGKAGKYLVGGAVGWDGAMAYASIAIVKNGTNMGQTQGGQSDGGRAFEVVQLLDLVQGDSIVINVFHGSGGSRNAGTLSKFWGVKVD